MLLGEFINDKVRLLEVAGADAPRTDVLAILELALDKNRAWVLSNEDYELLSMDLDKLNSLLKRRSDHEPLAYILGYKEFYGYKFKINNDVLIPRPESENIIEIAKDLPCQKFIDVGTGSGCLAVSLKLDLPSVKVYGLDISEKALNIAKVNAEDLSAKVEFFKSDLIKNIDKKLLDNACLLVNLPYVPDNLITSEEINKEPKLALFSGSDGMDLYKKFWEQIENLEHKPVYIITESLETQHFNMQKLAKKASFVHQETRDLIQLFVLIN